MYIQTVYSRIVYCWDDQLKQFGNHLYRHGEPVGIAIKKAFAFEEDPTAGQTREGKIPYYRGLLLAIFK